MAFPTSRRRRRLVLALFMAGAAAVALLGWVNIADYLRFRHAWHIAESIGQDGLRSVAEAATTEEKLGHHWVEETNVPPPFRSLRPLSASFYPGTTDLELYRLGEYFVFMRINTTPGNQRIIVFSNSAGEQQTKLVWERNPEADAALNPSDRLVTLSTSSMHDSEDWIVLATEIRIVERPYTNAGDRLVRTIPLSTLQREAIVAAANSIPESVRGRYFTTGGMDGVTLRIAFATDGDGKSALALANTWRDEVGPLLDAVDACLAPGDRIAFKEHATRTDAYPGATQFVSTWAELAAKDASYYRSLIPRWCLWRRWLPHHTRSSDM